MARFLPIFFAWVLSMVALSGKESPIFLEKWKVPVTELPLIAGSAKAEHWVIVFSKWNCQICGMMHHSWREVLKDFPGQNVGVVMMPGVSLQGVEPLQKLMLVVWRENPEVYEQLSTLIWGGGLSLNDVATIRLNAANFLGGEVVLAKAEKKHQVWVDQQVALSSEILRAMEQMTGDIGSYPKTLTQQKPGLGHLGSHANYRNFLVTQGWASADWAAKANAADSQAQENPAAAVMEHRKAMAPQRRQQILDLGKISMAAGQEGKTCEIPELLSAQVVQISSNHGSLQAKSSSDKGPLELHFTWLQGLGPGAWETTIFIKERSGKSHIVTVKGEMQKP